MAALYNDVVKYNIEATCMTPLRTGNAYGDVDQVLRDQHGNPFIQGNSLSGAFRDWFEKNRNKKLAEELFGGQETEGKLVISEGTFHKFNTNIRPRIRINKRMGTVDEGGKFDVTSVGTGSKFVFSIMLLTDNLQEQDETYVEEILAACNEGYIRLGANKSTGFGKVQLEVKKGIYHLENEKDREEWLDDNNEKLQPIQLRMTARNAMTEFHVSGHADNILIKSAAARQKNNETVTKNIMEAGHEIIPGTSMKGVIRGQVESILGTMGLPLTLAEEMFGCGSNGKSDGHSGQVMFEDVVLDQSKIQKITRIRINKVTGGVMRGHLFSEEPISSDVSFKILLPDNEAFCLLLLYALRDLGLGLCSIGSGASIGRGKIDLTKVQAKMPDGTDIQMLFDANRKITISDPNHILENWSERLEGVR